MRPRRLARWPLIFVVGCVSVGGFGVAAAATPGYDRVVVKAAGISLLIPDTWDVGTTSRKQAKQTLRDNPDLVKTGLTVEDLVSTPLQAGWDGNDDGYPDRWAVVERVRGVDYLPSPSAARSLLENTEGVKDLTMKRATVAGKPALVATFAQDLVRDDGSTVTPHSTTYFFVGPSKQMDLVQFFRLDSVDPEFDQMILTMNKSIRYVR